MSELRNNALNEAWERAYALQTGGSLWQEGPIPQLASAIHVLRGAQVEDVLDLGCGDGRNLVALARAGFRATGVDASSTACTRARSSLQRLGLQARVSHADAAQLPIVADSLDAVVSFDVFTHFLAPERVLSEVKRVLRPDGILIFNAYSVNDSEFGVGEPVAARQFLFKETLFRFYDEDELLGLLAEWDVLSIEEEFWDDPPHGDFRPYPHRHGAFVVTARVSA